MKAALTATGILPAAIALWYGWFYLEEQRKWGTPIRVTPRPPLDLDRCRRVL